MKTVEQTSQKLRLRFLRRFAALALCFAAAVSAANSRQARNAPLSSALFETLTTERGLTSNAATALFQDSRGFLWIGTSEGLNRYDGYSFVSYRHNPFDSSSLSGNMIFSICEDKRGNLWIGTLDGGLNKFDPVKRRFRRFPAPEAPQTKLISNTYSTNYTQRLFIDSRGMLWVGTGGGGVLTFDLEAERFTALYSSSELFPNCLAGNAIRAFCEDSAGVVWIATRGGLSGYDRARQAFRQCHQLKEKFPSLGKKRGGRRSLTGCSGACGCHYPVAIAPPLRPAKGNKKALS